MDIQLVFNQQNTDIGMLGRQGENNETRLVIDCQSVLAEHPDAVIGVRMMGRLPGEKYYDLPVTHEGDGVYVAKLSTFDLCWDGNKEIQVRAIVGEWEKRSARFQGYVAKSLFDFRPPTGVVSDWLDDLKKALAQAEAAQEHGPIIGENGHWYVWQDGAYADTGVKGEGSDGAPGAKGDKGDTGAPGKDGQNGQNGKDGEPGKDGADGVSPVVSVTAITGGHRVTITDKNGTQSFDVLNGKDGKDGEDGGGASVELDTTLTQSGKAADAKAVGDALAKKANTSAIPTQLSQLTGDSGNRTVTDAEKTAWNNKSNFSGAYNDLTGKPTIPDAYTKAEVDELLEGIGTGGGTGGGGGSAGGGCYYTEHTLSEAVEVCHIPLETTKYNRYTITVSQPNDAVSPSVSIVHNGMDGNYLKDAGTSGETYFFVELVESRWQSNGGTKMMIANSRRSNNGAANTFISHGLSYKSTYQDGVLVKGTTFAAGTKIMVRCWE